MFNNMDNKKSSRYLKPVKLHNPDSRVWIETWTSCRLDTKGIDSKIDTIKTVLSFIVATSFIGISILPNNQNNTDDEYFIKVAVWCGYISFLLSAIGISCVSGTGIIAADISDDYYQLQYLADNIKENPFNSRFNKKTWIR
jgi:hypothetical protein